MGGLRMGVKVGRFEDLEVWKEGMRLATKIYRALNTCRDYGLRDQMQRSAVSMIQWGTLLPSDRMKLPKGSWREGTEGRDRRSEKDRGQKSRGRGSEGKGQWSVVRGQWSVVRGQGSGVRKRNKDMPRGWLGELPEISGQMSEVRKGQRSGVGDQWSDIRGQQGKQRYARGWLRRFTQNKKSKKG